MKKYRIKNIVIAILGALLVYQTGMLWFGKNFGEVLLYNARNAVNLGRISPEEGDFVPEAVIAGYGNKLYRVIRSEKEYSEVSEAMLSSVEALADSGIKGEAEDTDWTEILQSKCVIYKFPVSVSAYDYFAKFGKKAAARLSEELESFDYAVISVQSAGSSHTDFHFIDSATGKGETFILEDNELSARMYERSETFREEVFRQMPHISSVENGFKLFKGNAFIPQWNGGDYYYNILYSADPFIAFGEFSEKLLNDYTDGFFSEFSVKRESKDVYRGTYLFSDDNVVVKYSKNGLLEYFDYGEESSSEQTVNSALKKAEDFILKDKVLLTGLFLTDVKIKSEGLVFYFDYEADNFPVELSAEIKENLDMESAIEVTVKNNRVKKYRRYMRNFYTSGNSSVVNTDFTYALESAASMHMEEGLSPEPEELYLAYSVDSGDIYFMNWYVELSGIKYKCATFSADGE